MSLAFKFETVSDTANPELQFIRSQLTPHRMAAEVGPRATRLVQRNFLTLGTNRRGWPSTHFWGRAAESTNWQEGFGFVMVDVNQIGVRQQLMGGDIKPVKAGALTLPAVPDANGKTAGEFSNLQFGFAYDAELGKMRPALVEKKGVLKIRLGRKKQDGTKTVFPVSTSTGLKAIFWLAKGVHQNPHPEVLPSDDEFETMMDQSVDSLLRHS